MIYRILDNAYRRIWVPVLGRVLFLFARLIEGRKIEDLPSYEIEDSKSINSVD